MAIERTLSIIKPDAVKNKFIGEIFKRFEANDLTIEMVVMVHLNKDQAESFYAEHKGKEFFDGLIEFMTSGPVVLSILRGENAVLKNRQLMGATDPKQAEPGTIRADFADEMPRNAVHGSDSLVSAEREINFFFKLEA